MLLPRDGAAASKSDPEADAELEVKFANEKKPAPDDVGDGWAAGNCHG